MSKKVDLTGQRFGRLVAIKNTGEKNNDGRFLWLCRCDCGNETKVYSDNLRKEKTKSCGCFRIDSARRLIGETYDKNFVEGTLVFMLNTKLFSTNKSGYKGVNWNKKANKWKAQIGFKGEVIYLGLFDNIQDAVTARAEAEEKYFKPILEKYGKLSD